MKAEEKARRHIDDLLQAAGWQVQDRDQANLGAALGVAVREFPLEKDAQTVYTDYLLFVDRKAAGVIEAKAAGTTLGGVADQSAVYQAGLPAHIPHVQLPLPFAYESTGIETLFTDECHRSIYNLWRQVLEYFDAHVIGLTATPSKQTLGFFHQNLVTEYGHERTVADGVNVGYEVYRICTEIGEGGSTVEAGYYVDTRDKLTRQVRQALLDGDVCAGRAGAGAGPAGGGGAGRGGLRAL